MNVKESEDPRVNNSSNNSLLLNVIANYEIMLQLKQKELQ